MTISPLREIVIFSSSLLSGVIIGVIYDMLRRIKRLLGCSSLLVDIGDVITFLMLSLCAYYAVYIINDGKIRWYEIFGIFSGFFMYMSTLSPYVIRFFVTFERVIKRILMFAKKILSPVIRLFLWTQKRAKNLYFRFKTRVLSKKRKKIRYLSKIKCIFRKI